MTYVDCEAQARRRFAELFEERARQEVGERAAETKRGREIKVGRRQESRQQFKRRKGWLHREVRAQQR